MLFNIVINDFLLISFSLFTLGMCGIVLGRKNIIIMLMSIELMLLAVNLNFLIFSVYMDDLIGQLFALLVLTVAAAEAAIGLAILVIYFRVRGTILVQFIHFIKG
jgi:NADH-quinone oxidoreductase subunit K